MGWYWDLLQAIFAIYFKWDYYCLWVASFKTMNYPKKTRFQSVPIAALRLYNIQLENLVFKNLSVAHLPCRYFKDLFPNKGPIGPELWRQKQWTPWPQCMRSPTSWRSSPCWSPTTSTRIVECLIVAILFVDTFHFIITLYHYPGHSS